MVCGVVTATFNNGIGEAEETYRKKNVAVVATKPKSVQ